MVRYVSSDVTSPWPAASDSGRPEKTFASYCDPQTASFAFCACPLCVLEVATDPAADALLPFACRVLMASAVRTAGIWRSWTASPIFIPSRMIQLGNPGAAASLREKGIALYPVMFRAIAIAWPKSWHHCPYFALCMP